MHDSTDNTTTAAPKTVLDHAERLIGRAPVLINKSDDQIKRLVVDQLLNADHATHSDSFIDGAWQVLIGGDSRIPVARRKVRLERTEMLRRATPAGRC